MKIAIVGGGLAAAKVAEGYRAAGGDGEVELYAGEAHVPYSRPPLSKRLLRGESEPQDAYVHPEDWYREQGVHVHTSTTVASLDDVEADTIVLATGARPRALGDALVLRTLDDSLELRRRAGDAKTATVIGGGFIGCEVTASLTQLGVQVTQIVREPHVFATLEAPPFSDALHDLFRERGVDLRLEASDAPEADMTVAGIGVVPNIELARDAGLEVNHGVVVNDRFESSRPGVYAVGDVAEFYDPLYGRHRRIEHWSTANYHGSQLGKILAGDEDARYSVVSSFFSEMFGYGIRLFGDPAGHDSLDVDGDFGAGKAILRYRSGGRTIAGLTTGQDDEAHKALEEEIREGAAAVAAS